ncbi:hypothetical protein R3P38DRAFT_2815565 [Favolaschia claudopus]|uniref:Uncharacterized protein n=1 Tax=Favolaschia claudopus TaxID=2862362 RepID=A0AAV9Z0Y9_9AGAR
MSVKKQEILIHTDAAARAASSEAQGLSSVVPVLWVYIGERRWGARMQIREGGLEVGKNPQWLLVRRKPSICYKAERTDPCIMAPTAMRHKAIDKSTFIPKPYVIAGRFAVRVRTSGLSARQRLRMLVIAERGFLPGVVFYRAAMSENPKMPDMPEYARICADQAVSSEGV